MAHEKIKMLRDKKYKINDIKYHSGHCWRCGCNCPDIVLNLLIGSRIWTRVKFDCGEVIRINCACLDEI
jgi:hypothetical protein